MNHWKCNTRNWFYDGLLPQSGGNVIIPELRETTPTTRNTKNRNRNAEDLFIEGTAFSIFIQPNQNIKLN